MCHRFRRVIPQALQEDEGVERFLHDPGEGDQRTHGLDSRFLAGSGLKAKLDFVVDMAPAKPPNNYGGAEAGVILFRMFVACILECSEVAERIGLEKMGLAFSFGVHISPGVECGSIMSVTLPPQLTWQADLASPTVYTNGRARVEKTALRDGKAKPGFSYLSPTISSPAPQAQPQPGGMKNTPLLVRQPSDSSFFPSLPPYYRT